MQDSLVAHHLHEKIARIFIAPTTTPHRAATVSEKLFLTEQTHPWWYLHHATTTNGIVRRFLSKTVKRTRPIVFPLLALAFVLSTAPAHAQLPVSPLIVSETSVIQFMPPIPTGDVQSGSCWTESIAVNRPGAWRCTVGNAISDPCFTIPGKRKRLVCGADPALKTEGFVLKLTKPLPKSSLADRKPDPWVFRLADNSICEAMTGTLPAVNGEPARWSCAIHIRDQVRPDGVVTSLTPGKIWMADKFPESAISVGPPKPEKVEPEKVPVKVVWQ
jgi:hypothetical protein